MINSTGIRVEKAVNIDQILYNTEHKLAVGIILPQSMGVEDEEGHKIVKAGTPVSFDLMDRNKEAEAATAANVTGIVQHDVDVTYGPNNGSAFIFAFVNTNRLAEDVKTLLTDDIKKALPLVTFLAG